MAQKYLTINEDVFYKKVRHSVFNGRISKNQFDGMRRLIAIWGKYCSHLPVEELAYNLGTARGETGNMQPIKERGKKSYFNKYNAGTKLGRVLGNTEPGDGFRFRGEGHVQNTGRKNARHSSSRLNDHYGFGVDFEANPDQRGVFLYSALCLFIGNNEGWWTTRKLSDYSRWYDKRRVVNGTDKAAKFAAWGKSFLEALEESVIWVEEWPRELNQFVGDGSENEVEGKTERKTTMWSWIASVGIGLLGRLFPQGKEGGWTLRSWIGGLLGVGGAEQAGARIDLTGILGALGGLDWSTLFGNMDWKSFLLTAIAAVLGVTAKEGKVVDDAKKNKANVGKS